MFVFKSVTRRSPMTGRFQSKHSYFSDMISMISNFRIRELYIQNGYKYKEIPTPICRSIK